MASTSKSCTTLLSKRSIQPQYGRFLFSFLGVNYRIWSTRLSSGFKADALVISLQVLPEKTIRLAGIQQDVKRAPGITGSPKYHKKRGNNGGAF